MSEAAAIRIDYRLALVLDMELVAHSVTCKQCMASALLGNTDKLCDQMKHMQEYIRWAYEHLPPDYKLRYQEAMNTVMAITQKAGADVETR